MQERLLKIQEKTSLALISILVFLLPMFFLPILPDFFESAKQILLFTVTALLLVLFLVKMIVSREVNFKVSAFDLPVLILATGFGLSTFLITPNKLEALVAPSATGTILVLTVLYFMITNNVKEELLKKLLKVLTASGLALAVFEVLQFLGVIEKLAPTEWLKSKAFTPTGSLVTLAMFLAVILLLGLIKFFPSIKENRKPVVLVKSLLPLFVLSLGLIVSVYQTLSSFKPLLLPVKTGWDIAIETLKQSPLWGFGPNNFLSAFTRFKMMDTNAGDLWAVRFGVSSNWYFQLMTATGVIGLFAVLYIVLKVLKNIKGSTGVKRELVFGLTLVFILFALLPSNLVALFLTYLFLAFLGITMTKREFSEKSVLLPWMISIPVVAIVIASGYFMIKDVKGQIYYAQSLEAYAKNDGTNTYNLQINAITAAPYITNYRITYSQTNLALANVIASKQDLTDQDRQNISVLIQQAISEAKAAVSLAPQNVIAWENLATTYRGLINIAQGADQWTIAAYQQAITLDPLNPNLRVSLGGVYYSLKDWENAQKQFEFAVQLKSDFANSHYNLAAALKEQNKIDRAAAELEAVLTLVPKDSQDYQKTQSELDALKVKITAAQAAALAAKQGETLATPTPAQKGIKPQIPLPTEAAPQISPVPSQGAQNPFTP